MFPPLLSQLAHVEVLTTRPEESLAFYTEVLGLHETGRQAQSVYLRCWGEPFHHSVVLTEAPKPGVAHVGWRAAGPEQLSEAVRRLEESGAGEGWEEPALGHGAAYRYRTPGGQLHELFWDVDRLPALTGLESQYPARFSRMPTRGLPVRQIDHVTAPSPDVLATARWFRDTLGYRFMEYALLEPGSDIATFAAVTTNEKSHTVGIVYEPTAMRGRTHHVAFWVDESVDVYRAADLVAEAGVPAEYGPTRHGIGENTCLYFREPGGMRIELHSGGYRNYEPDWNPVAWTRELGSNDFYRNNDSPPSFRAPIPDELSNDALNGSDERRTVAR
jgi:catechol 2,3-dioxygenase